jgi:malonyl CoA-acyl carrier protein transacylase
MQDLKKKMAVQILGPMGLEIEMVSSRDLKPFRDDYDILVESSIAEAQSNLADSKNKLTFLGAYKGDQTINQKVLFETQATIAGVDDDTIKRLLDTSDYDAIEVVAQADEAFQIIIGGDKAPLYKDANTAFLQRLHDLSDKYDHELSTEQHNAVFAYIDEITPIVEKNAARSVMAQAAKEGLISRKGRMVDGTDLENPDLAATGAVRLGDPGAEAAETAALSK